MVKKETNDNQVAGVKLRLDKWLFAARVFKTRTQATRACSLGRVQVNGQVAKAHRAVSPEDQIEVRRRHGVRILRVRELHDKPLPKIEAQKLYEDLTPEQPPQDPITRARKEAPVAREKGRGRPSKRERRQLKRWEEDDSW